MPLSPKARKAALLALVGGGGALLVQMYRAAKKADGIEAAAASSAASSDNPTPNPLAVQESQGKKRRSAGGVDARFFARLRRLLGIMVPGVASTEFGYIGLVSAAMLARTWCDVWMIQNGTSIERAIISRDPKRFYRLLLDFAAVMFPISCVNNVLKYSLGELHLRFRERLTTHLYSQYLRGFTYYKMSNLDNRISNPDQLLTQDVDRFAQSVADLYSNISKPILDMVIYTVRLSGAIGAQGPAKMLGYLLISGVVLTKLRKPVAKFTVTEQKLEGEFRYVNSRLITNSEEVSFYNGNKKEQQVISGAFDRLVGHLRTAMQFRYSIGIVDTIIAKYLATVVGYLSVSPPFLDKSHPRHLNSTHGEIMQDYYLSGRMLINMAMAVGRLVLAGRELTRLSGFTARIDELLTVLKDLNHGKYTRTMVKREGADADKLLKGEEKLEPNSGDYVEQDHIIRFEDVPLVTPNGDVLIRKLNMEVKSGMNVLVAGPNGCGKSSLFRTLGELWPLFGGRLTKPNMSQLFYVPQRPYMTLGTLRDQIIYPHDYHDFVRSGRSDADLMELLQKVELAYLVEREGGWNTVSDWMDVLSGGEKQRVAMARMFYHRPQFAILDECTSAVSVDVEGNMYSHCRTLGITLFTVSHRKSLWKYHEYVLRFDGRGQYEYLPRDQVQEYGS